MTLLVIYFVLAIGASFLCSLLEASLLSLPPSYVASVAEGSRTGRLLWRLKSEIDRPLAAILTLNTVAHTIGAAGVGAQAAIVFGRASVGLVSGVMTLLILLLSEIVPKTLGAVYAKPLAGFTAWATQGLIVLCYPLVVICEWLGRMLSRGRPPQRVSREEVLSMAQMGRQDGVLTPDEALVIRNLIRLRDVRAADIMTPRSVVFSLPENTTVGEAYRQPLPFARIPLVRESLDHVVGVVHRYRVFEAHAAGKASQSLAQLATPASVIPEQATVAQALERFVRSGEHLFQVVDEYGGTAGILTLEDALETLLGIEIVDETDTVADMRELARQLTTRRTHRQEERLRHVDDLTRHTASRPTTDGPT